MEVGARGYCSTSVRGCLRKLGLGRVRTNRVIKEAGDASLRSSYWIWLSRERFQWEGGNGFKVKENESFKESNEKAASSRTIKTTAPIRNTAQENNCQAENILPVTAGVRGLLNCGNTCFINASLQMLRVVWDDIGIPCQSKLGNLLHGLISQLKSDSSGPFYPVKILSEIKLYLVFIG